MKLIKIKIGKFVKNLQFFDIVSIVSSVSTPKLKCPSSAWLSSARAGKFQLGLITNSYIVFQCLLGTILIPDSMK